MERDVMKMILGILFMGILPVLFVWLQKKKDCLFKDEILRPMISLLTMANICGVLLFMGNVEVAFAVILGSIVFQIMVIDGILYIQGKYNCKYEIQSNFQKGKKGDYFEQVDGSNVFLCISFILLLILCADYLFGKKPGENALGRVDGCILVAIGVVYFFLEGRKYGFGTYGKKIWESIQKDLVKKILFLLIMEGCIFLGSYLLVDGMLVVCVQSSILPYTVGFIFLSWCVNIINIAMYSFDERMEKSTSNQECIFSITIFMGLCAVSKIIYISTYEIYDIIIISVILILFMISIKKGERADVPLQKNHRFFSWHNTTNKAISYKLKIDNRFAGCCKVTAYLALILYILFR